MSNSRELLEKLRNIGEECFDIESDATNWKLSSEGESDYIQSETSDAEANDEEAITNDEAEAAVDGTIWLKFAKRDISGRSPSACVFKGVKGPTGYANHGG